MNRLYLEIKEKTSPLTIDPIRILGLFDSRDNLETFGASIETINVNHTPRRVDQCNLKGWEFTVPDTEIGLRAVAGALGYGMCSPKDSDDCATLYKKWGIYRNKQGFTFFNQPVILLSTKYQPGRRAAWGGVCEVRTTVRPSQDLNWEYAVYDLKPGLPDGGILIQSGGNAAIIKAEKRGDYWTIDFTTPINEEGNVIAMRFEACFRHGFNWYRNKDLQQQGRK